MIYPDLQTRNYKEKNRKYRCIPKTYRGCQIQRHRSSSYFFHSHRSSSKRARKKKQQQQHTNIASISEKETPPLPLPPLRSPSSRAIRIATATHRLARIGRSPPLRRRHKPMTAAPPTTLTASQRLPDDHHHHEPHRFELLSLAQNHHSISTLPTLLHLLHRTTTTTLSCYLAPWSVKTGSCGGCGWRGLDYMREGETEERTEGDGQTNGQSGGSTSGGAVGECRRWLDEGEGCEG